MKQTRKHLMVRILIMISMSTIPNAYCIDWLWPIKALTVWPMQKIYRSILHQWLIDAAQKGDAAYVRELLALPTIAINTQDSKGNSALIKAARYGRIEIVEMLLNAGAQIDLKNNNGDTALFKAIHHNQPHSISTMLINAGADVNSEGSKGESMLMHAVWMDNNTLAHLLIAAGADVNRQTNQGSTKGWTPLMAIAFFNNQELCHALLTAGADINMQDEQGCTALMQAAYWNKKEVLEILIKAHADLNIQSARGITALMGATYGSKGQAHKDIIEILIASRARILCNDLEGKTALDIAQAKGNTEIVELLQHALDKENEEEDIMVKPAV